MTLTYIPISIYHTIIVPRLLHSFRTYYRDPDKDITINVLFYGSLVRKFVPVPPNRSRFIFKVEKILLVGDVYQNSHHLHDGEKLGTDSNIKEAKQFLPLFVQVRRMSVSEAVVKYCVISCVMRGWDDAGLISL